MSAQELVPTPILASVAVVCRSQPRVAALQHVALTLDAFLDPSGIWSLADACQFGSVRLLDRVGARSDVLALSGDSVATKAERQRQFELGMECAVANGYLPVVQWLARRWPSGDVPSHVVSEAAKKGQLAILEWLFEHHDNVFWGGDEMYYAVANNHLEVAKFLNDHTSPPADDAFLIDEAAQHGDLEMMRWLHEERGDQLTYDGVMRAVDRGYLSTVQWMCANFPGSVVTSDIRMDKAAANGHLAMVQWLHDQKAWCTMQALNRAAGNGHLKVVQFLHTHRPEGCTTDAMDLAAANGHLEMVKWLHDHRLEGCTQFAMDAAAKNGYLDVVQWLHTHRNEGCSTRAMDDAAAAGHLEMVQWLQANRIEGCTAAAVEDAMANGHHEVATWLRHTFPDKVPPVVEG